MREQALSDGRTERPIVLAYSANPALSSSTIAACVDAGASGVVRPPYTLETAAMIQRMARATSEGRISSIVGMPTSDSPSPVSPVLDDSQIKVVLPPTALLGGGQHEGERVLNAHRRKTSGTWDNQISSAHSRDASASRSGPASRKQSRQELAPLSISVSAAARPTQLEENLDTEIDSATYALYQPSQHRRRRSVDVGGLATAMKRAQKAFDGAMKPVSNTGIIPPSPVSPVASMRPDPSVRQAITPGASSAAKLPDPELQQDEVDTHLAELLGAMYYQTCLTIDVQMAEYAE